MYLQITYAKGVNEDMTKAYAHTYIHTYIHIIAPFCKQSKSQACFAGKVCPAGFAFAVFERRLI